MSAVPAEIAGIGSTTQRLRVSPGFDPLKAAVGPEDYFVLSRIDGTQTLRDVLLSTGLPIDRAVSIVARLRSIGAVLLPGEAASPGGGPPQRPSAPKLPSVGKSQPLPALPRTLTPSSVTAARPPSIAASPIHDLTLPGATSDELGALAEDVDLDDRERRRILAMARLAHGRDPHALLGVPASADARTLKLAYFQLSKEVHPDRYYGKRLGSFGARMSSVFEATSRAYARLTTNDRGRSSAHAQSASDLPQTPQEYAAELFDRACQLEIGGDALEAMKLFAAAVRMDAQTRFLRRAASCALAAGQPKTAVEYAKKAHTLTPNDASAARLLALAFRAAGKLVDAEEVLVIAMAMKSENDTLSAELRNDLSEVRRLLLE